MTDRPTGPATARIRAFVGPHFSRYSHAKDDLEEALAEAATAERARILAALPEALYSTVHAIGEHENFCDCDNLAAALAAAIEKEECQG